jgi:hypothetical protein
MPFSESWATAYIQILIALFIFAVGILALSIPIVKDDVRTVFHRRRKGTLSYFFVASILGIFIFFVWFLQPSFKRVKDNRNPPVNIPVTVTSSGKTEQKLPEERFIITVGQPRMNDTVVDDKESYFIPFIASLLMTGITTGLVVILFRYSTQLNRLSVVKELEQELIKNLNEDQSTKNWRRKWLASLYSLVPGKKRKKRRSKKKRQTSQNNFRNHSPGYLQEDSLHDLIYLGRNGQAGREKKLVLDALDHLASRVQDAPTYQGDELEDLIRSLKEILLSGEQLGNDDNFNDVFEILKNIRYRISQLTYMPKYIDAWLADTILEELGVEAIKANSIQVAERFLEEASFSSKSVFNIGLIALDNKHFHTATMALNKLEGLAKNRNLTVCSETFDLLGLIAHFTTSGIATKMRADSFMSKNLTHFLPSIDDCLLRAYDHHYLSSDFETADVIFELRQELTSKH